MVTARARAHAAATPAARDHAAHAAHAAPTPPPNPFVALLADTQAVMTAVAGGGLPDFASLLAAAAVEAPSEDWLLGSETAAALARAGLRGARRADSILRVKFYRDPDGSYRTRTDGQGRRQWFVVCSVCGSEGCGLSHWVTEP